MYGALWRILPGPWWLRLLILLVAAAAVLAGLVLVVFPAVQLLIEPPDVVVGS
ncbi:MAG TPA: hypothetical protein VN200_04845 [Rhodoglobus sp.]|nr:hypothetical protein [Rhodoglobus sp.]